MRSLRVCQRRAWRRAWRKLQMVREISGVTLSKLGLNGFGRVNISLAEEIHAVQQRRVEQQREVQQREAFLTAIHEARSAHSNVEQGRAGALVGVVSRVCVHAHARVCM